MIRLIFVSILFLQSCSYFSFYRETAQLIASTVSPDSFEVTKTFYDNFDYSFAKLRIGRSDDLIIVLANYENGLYEWVSSDKVRIITNKFGKIVNTFGLDSDLDIKNYYINKFSGNYIFNTSFTSPELNYARTYAEIKLSNRTNFDYLSEEKYIEIFEESISIPSIFWKAKNYYYFDDGRPLFTRQNIHPNIPQIEIEFYIK